MPRRNGTFAAVRRRKSPRARAFTIVELLVVVSIVAVLIGLLAPAVAGIRAESKSVACISNLRQIWTAIEMYRQRTETLLPFAEPLPAAAPVGPASEPPIPQVEGGLCMALDGIVPRDGEHWHCPADDSDDYELLKTSYAYVAGGWMLLLPPNPSMTQAENALSATRRITKEYDSGILRNMPLVADSADRHTRGDREPRNVVFIDGTARILKPTDIQVQQLEGQ